MKRTVSCAICGSLFETSHSQSKYCSPEHQAEGRRSSSRQYTQANKDAIRAYARAFYANNKEKKNASVAAYRATPAGKEAARVNDQRQREKYPDRYAARQAVLVAMRSGKLARMPCARCGENKTHAHHHDYAKPLEVEWLCDHCHKLEHGRVAQSSPEMPATARHVLEAERALGRRLPSNAVVYRADSNVIDGWSLVICPDLKYRQLLRQRAAAIIACGHADWRLCRYCHSYDDPSGMYAGVRRAAHRECHRNYRIAMEAK